MKKNGNNFNENPLTFEEFVDTKDRSVPIYNNFFYNFYVYVSDAGRNYKKLKIVNKELADELSVVYREYCLERREFPAIDRIEGHRYPINILEKGYQTYLLLRENFSKDAELLMRIEDYYDGYEENDPKYDDWPAFFS